MTNGDEQEREELAVFREFAKVCPLPLLATTAQKRPQRKSDILCELDSGEKLVFEFVECEDVTRNGSKSGRYEAVLPKRAKRKSELESAIRQANRTTLEDRRINQPKHFECHSIHVDFEDGFPSKNRTQKAAEQAIELIDRHGAGRHTTKEYGIIRIQCCQRQTPLPPDEPNFSVRSGCGARPYIVERIKQKLAKNYETKLQIHLLAWSTTATISEFQGTERDKELTASLQAKGMGPFDRVWVFGYRDKEILFDSATTR